MASTPICGRHSAGRGTAVPRLYTPPDTLPPALPPPASSYAPRRPPGNLPPRKSHAPSSAGPRRGRDPGFPGTRRCHTGVHRARHAHRHSASGAPRAAPAVRAAAAQNGRAPGRRRRLARVWARGAVSQRSSSSSPSSHARSAARRCPPRHSHIDACVRATHSRHRRTSLDVRRCLLQITDANRLATHNPRDPRPYVSRSATARTAHHASDSLRVTGRFALRLVVEHASRAALHSDDSNTKMAQRLPRCASTYLL